MRPLFACASARPASPAASALPRFWRITFADLVALWGEEQAEQMLDAMRRSFENQEPESGWGYASGDPQELQ